MVDGSGGPDLFGHVWIDSDEPGGPVFSWTDISGTGTEVILGDDDFLGVTLPFTFSYYGNDRDAILVCSNGYLTFGADGIDFSNDPIPDPLDPNDLIAPFWDDLNPTEGGTIHYQSSETEFIVQYTDIEHYSLGGVSGTYTFQVILYPNGELLYQYLTLIGEIESTTIGIENDDGSDGLEVVYNAAYLHDSLAVRFHIPPNPDLFWDDFESYNAGEQLALQNPVDWDTWSNTPGSGEDPFVSDSFAFSGSNSTVIVENNDLIRHHGMRTTGSWGISMQTYIPAGKSGYFNTMSGFAPNPNYWAMEVYFDAGGAGRLLTGGPQVDFSWVEDTWHHVEVIVDLDQDLAQLVLDGMVLSQWQWTLGASGGTGPLQLDVNDFFGATANDELYFDDFHFAADTLRSTTGVASGSELPQRYELSQNYPNPFNPDTRIQYSLPQQANVKLTIFNLLGQEIVSLVDGTREAGIHEVVWDARTAFGSPVGTGLYYYRLEASSSSGESFVMFRKMLFLK
ncbi:MAG: T9SS type A sorting domain-containing protein [Ignavibacteria bacterium]|nr:T9SS type A sorting domain-containing protein [Ignavibacteria bacterium]